MTSFSVSLHSCRNMICMLENVNMRNMTVINSNVNHPNKYNFII